MADRHQALCAARGPLTIGGRPVAADTYAAIRNPANTEEIVGEAPLATAEHLDQAVAAGKKVFRSWRNSSDAERASACEAIAKVCADDAEELAVLLTKEQGKPLGGIGSRYELAGCSAAAE